MLHKYIWVNKSISFNSNVLHKYLKAHKTTTTTTITKKKERKIKNENC